LDPIYYLITFICVAGGCYSGFKLGSRDGIERFISFLEAHTDNHKIVKLKITGENVEFIK